MRNVNIILNQASLTMPGYENINIQEFAMSDSKYENIFIGNCLSYLEYGNAIKLLFQIIEKLNKGGVLTIQNFDIMTIASKMVDGQLDFEIANNLLAQKMSHHSIFSIMKSLSPNNKCQIEKKDVENLNFILKLRKVNE